MVQQITEGINIKVEVIFKEILRSLSNPHFIFAYQITIENLSSFPVQLLSRRWLIKDSTGLNREVIGEGVVGIQPILMPNESYQYMSSVDLESELGKMNGSFTMENKLDKRLFDVIVPEFILVCPAKLN